MEAGKGNEDYLLMPRLARRLAFAVTAAAAAAVAATAAAPRARLTPPLPVLKTRLPFALAFIRVEAAFVSRFSLIMSSKIMEYAFSHLKVAEHI